jgi:hypothetical protein
MNDRKGGAADTAGHTDLVEPAHLEIVAEPPLRIRATVQLQWVFLS